MKKYGLLFLCLLALPVSAKTVNSRYVPVKNPNPQYFLTITGHVIGKNRGHFSLIAVYSTLNQQCDIKYHDFAGSSSSRERHIHYDINLAHPNFFLEIPLQYYFPGYCRWQLGGIDQEKNGHKVSALFIVRKTEAIVNSHLIMKYNKIHGWIAQNYLPQIKNNKNYDFSMTFQLREKE